MPCTSETAPAGKQEKNRPLRRLAGLLSQSSFLRRGRDLWEKNQKNYNLPLSKWEKLQVGTHLILKDYCDGTFPPRFLDQQEAYRKEIDYRTNVPGVDFEEFSLAELRKPFWPGGVRLYLQSFLKLTALLQEQQVQPPAGLLELGGGTGWTAELLAQLGYKVVSTTISHHDAATARKRLESLKVRGLPVKLYFQICPMEEVKDHVKDHFPFDAVFVHEALHHAFDWRAAISSAFWCLRPGGCFIICNEPNRLHTAISYRVAKLSQTHEIGFGKWQLTTHLRKVGFKRVISRGKWPGLLVRPHWLVAQK